MIIYSPASISFSGSCAVTPPGIGLFIRIKISICIYITVIFQLIQPLSFYRQKARGVFICFRIFQINRMMCSIIISKNQNFFPFFPKLLTVIQNLIIKIQLVIQSFFAPLTIGKINIKKNKVRIFCFKNPSFPVKSLYSQSIFHQQWFFFSIKCNTTVSLFFTKVKIGMIIIYISELLFQLIILNPYFLQTQNIRLFFFYPV